MIGLLAQTIQQLRQLIGQNLKLSLPILGKIQIPFSVKHPIRVRGQLFQTAVTAKGEGQPQNRQQNAGTDRRQNRRCVSSSPHKKKACRCGYGSDAGRYKHDHSEFLISQILHGFLLISSCLFLS